MPMISNGIRSLAARALISSAIGLAAGTAIQFTADTITPTTGDVATLKNPSGDTQKVMRIAYLVEMAILGGTWGIGLKLRNSRL